MPQLFAVVLIRDFEMLGFVGAWILDKIIFSSNCFQLKFIRTRVWSGKNDEISINLINSKTTKIMKIDFV